MKKLLIQALATALCCYSTAYAQVSLKWHTLFQDSALYGVSIHGKQSHVVDANGNLYIGGNVSDSIGNVNPLLLRYNSEGKFKWQRSDRFMGNYSSVMLTDSQRVFSFGTTVGGAFSQTHIYISFRVTDSTGRLVWNYFSFPYDCSMCVGMDNSFQQDGNLIYDSDGDIYFYGTVSRTSSVFDLLVAGKGIPYRHLNGYSFINPRQAEFSIRKSRIQPEAMALDKKKNMLIAAYIYSNDIDSVYKDLMLSSIDSAGKINWIKTYNYQSGSMRNTVPVSVVTDDSGNVYVAANTDAGAGNLTGLILKYSSSGVLLSTTNFSDIFPNETSAWINDMKMNNNSQLVIAGSVSENGKTKVLATAFDFNGKMIWSDQKNSMLSHSKSKAAVLDKSGNLYILAESYNSLNSIATILKYNSRGVMLWIKDFKTGEFQTAESISVNTSGDVYIAGNVYSSDSAPKIYAACFYQTLKAGFTFRTECGGKVHFLNASTDKAPLSYEWHFGDTKTSADENPDHVFLPGKYKVLLTAIGSKGNTDTISAMITINPLPEACFSHTVRGMKHTFTAKDTGLVAYTWIFNNKDTLHGHTVTYISTSNPLQASLMVSDRYGCENSCSQVITGVEHFERTRDFVIYPNPLTEQCTLYLDLKKSSSVTVRATDALGRTKVLYNEDIYPAGKNVITLNPDFVPGLIVFSVIIDHTEIHTVKAFKL